MCVSPGSFFANYCHRRRIPCNIGSNACDDGPEFPAPRGEDGIMRKLRIGLALGSGAARGWAHIGVIETLRAQDIAVDVVAGTSMGALIGAALASGRLDSLRDWALKLDWRGIVRLLDVTVARGGLIVGGEIIAMLADLGIAGAIEALPLPYVAVATDLLT
ncbi:MAG TPA: hypothetical protein ENK13_01730, partial [Thermopetrobacter sp.]|nr:hypothetical protein [Thermopetrobacter sp.]